MRWLATILTGASVLMLSLPGVRLDLLARVGVYLRPTRQVNRPTKAAVSVRVRRAGLNWTSADLVVRRVWAAASGAGIGLMLAQGDLFLPGRRSAPTLALLGAVGGVIGFRAWMAGRQEQRSRRLGHELPTITDAIALHVSAGEPVTEALENFSASAMGVASEEIGRVLRAHEIGTSLPEALQGAARETAHPDAGRLYSLLANAHDAGGRLADALAELAADYRSSTERALTTEGGRRALATYGPILALMVPTTLLFLIFPTLAGLKQLSIAP